jgi:hypothetical protein
LSDDDLEALASAFAEELEGLGAEGRMELVNAARRAGGWPSKEYLAGHAKKWGEGRRPEQYADWAQTVKKRAGIEVYAYIHPVQRNRGLAFVDHREGVVVNYDLDQQMNFDCFVPARPTRLWIADKLASKLYRRIRDTEL